MSKLKIISICLICFILGGITMYSLNTYAATLIESSIVTYSNEISGSTKDNVKEAIDDLYLKVNEIKDLPLNLEWHVGTYTATGKSCVFTVPETTVAIRTATSANAALTSTALIYGDDLYQSGYISQLQRISSTEYKAIHGEGRTDVSSGTITTNYLYYTIDETAASLNGKTVNFHMETQTAYAISNEFEVPETSVVFNTTTTVNAAMANTAFVYDGVLYKSGYISDIVRNGSTKYKAVHGEGRTGITPGTITFRYLYYTID